MKTATFPAIRLAFRNMNAKSVLRGAFLALGGVVFLAACQSTGDISDPFSRRSAWGSFISGGDIRAACQPGSPATYRLVYNANREDQVRIYDLTENDHCADHE